MVIVSLEKLPVLFEFSCHNHAPTRSRYFTFLRPLPFVGRRKTLGSRLRHMSFFFIASHAILSRRPTVTHTQFPRGNSAANIYWLARGFAMHSGLSFFVVVKLVLEGSCPTLFTVKECRVRNWITIEGV